MPGSEIDAPQHNSPSIPSVLESCASENDSVDGNFTFTPQEQARQSKEKVGTHQFQQVLKNLYKLNDFDAKAEESAIAKHHADTIAARRLATVDEREKRSEAVSITDSSQDSECERLSYWGDVVVLNETPIDPESARARYAVAVPESEPSFFERVLGSAWKAFCCLKDFLLCHRSG